MIQAIIDIGSNTVRMAIYQIDSGRIEMLMKKKHMVGLAAYLKNGEMQQQGIDKLCEVLNEFKEFLSSFRITDITAFTTAALRQHHQGPIRVIHQAHDAAGHYLAEPLQALVATHPQLDVQLLTASEQAAFLAQLRLVSRQTVALLCGSPASVETFARRLFILGVPRSQVLADLFLPHA